MGSCRFLALDLPVNMLMLRPFVNEDLLDGATFVANPERTRLKPVFQTKSEMLG